MEAFFANLSMGWNTVYFVIGAVLVIWGAEKFLTSAVFIALAANIPKVVVGATLVSMATTFPEFSVSFSAVLLAKPLLSVGNAVGSYLCNIGLIIGLSALIRPIPVSRKIFKVQGLFALGAILALMFAAGGNSVGRPAGTVFILGFLAFLYYNWRLSLTENDQESVRVEFTLGEWSRQTVWFFLGGASVGVGSILLVQNGAAIARHVGVSELIIGLTIVAVGTSLPEITLAILSMLRGHGDLSLGNILGANVLNVFWVVGASALARDIPIVPQTRALDLPFSLLLVVGLLVFGLGGNRINRVEGGLIVGAYLVYLALMSIYFLG